MKSLFFLFVFFSSLTGAGQTKDYLVKTNGDTLYGNVELKSMAFYVGMPNSSLTEVNIDEVSKVKSINYKGTAVVHCVLQLYRDDLNELWIDSIYRAVVDTVMILDEIMTTPRINLYYGKDNFKRPFYFYKTPADAFPVQLVVRYYLQGGLSSFAKDRSRYQGDRSKLHLVEVKGYVNQLRFIMGNCKEIEGIWEILSYRDYSLKHLIRKYNQCN
jgi:hypothetical protein